MTPVVQGLEEHEVVYAKDQPQYMPLPTLRSPDGRVMTRWSFSPEEREAISKGADLYLTMHTFNGPLQPVQLQVIQLHDAGELARWFRAELELPTASCPSEPPPSHPAACS